MLLETPGIAGLRAGTATGLMLMTQRIGAAVFPIVFAAVATTTSMVVSLCVITGFAVVAAIFYLFTKETGMGREEAKRRKEEKKALKI